MDTTSDWSNDGFSSLPPWRKTIIGAYLLRDVALVLLFLGDEQQGESHIPQSFVLPNLLSSSIEYKGY
jgi:hypothetical protein